MYASIIAVFSLLALVSAHNDVTSSRRLPRDQVAVYKAEDISHISLYGSSAVYKPERCPGRIKFINRARHLPELATDKIGILPSDIVVDGHRCSSDALMIDFAPLATTSYYPPQWVFEDSTFSGHPMNFTCGRHSFSIRYGYFNDVSTKYTNGLLDRSVVYFDFAVIPNTNPFAFCSYSGRRTDGQQPLSVAPFPTRETWEVYVERRGDLAVGSQDPSDEDELQVVETPWFSPSSTPTATPTPSPTPWTPTPAKQPVKGAKKPYGKWWWAKVEDRSDVEGLGEFDV